MTLCVVPAKPVQAETIPREKYMNDKEIKDLVIDEDVTSIGDRAYYGCTNLETVVIPEGVTRIGESAFAMCPNLYSVSIPSTVKSIAPGVFAGDTSLSTLSFPKGNYNFYFVAGALYNQNGTRLISYLPGKEYSFYDMPDQVEYIDNYAFWGAYNLEKVYVSPNVETITPYAFAYCTGLRYIFLPESVESIQEYAFRDCKNLKYIYEEGKRVKMDETALFNASKPDTVSGANLDKFNQKCVVEGEEEEAEAMRQEALNHQDGNKEATTSGSSSTISDAEWGILVAKNSHITSNTHPGNNFGVVDSMKTGTGSSGSSGSSSTAPSGSASTSSSSSSSSSSSVNTGSSSSSSSANPGSTTSSSSTAPATSTSSSTATSTGDSSEPVTIINYNYYHVTPDRSKELSDYRKKLTEKLSGPYNGGYYGSLN